MGTGSFIVMFIHMMASMARVISYDIRRRRSKIKRISIKRDASMKENPLLYIGETARNRLA